MNSHQKPTAPKDYQCPKCDRYLVFQDLNTDQSPIPKEWLAYCIPRPGAVVYCTGCGTWLEMSKNETLVIPWHKPKLETRLAFLIALTME